VTALSGRRGLIVALSLLALGAALLLLSGSSAVGWVAVAGIAGVLATAGLLRRLVGLLLVLVGLAAAAVAVWGVDLTGGTGVRWPWVAALGGAMVAAAGIVVLGFAQHWSALSRKYERGGDMAESTPLESAPLESTPAESTPLDLWRALDRGEDPTER